MAIPGRFDVKPEIRSLAGMTDEYAEFDIIVHLLREPENARNILEYVRNDMFTSTKRGQIFEAIIGLVADSENITPDNVLKEARRNAIRLGEVCEVSDADLASAKKYAMGSLDSSISQVVRTYSSRRYMEVIMWGAEKLGALETDGFAAEMQDRMDRIMLPPRTYTELMRGGDVISLTERDQQNITARWDSGMVADLSWPWESMARAPRLLPGWFGIFAGTDGGMKTAFTECCVEGWCKRKGGGRKPRCLYVHTEYGPEIMRQRRLARWSGVPLDRLLIGNTTPQDRKEIALALEKMQEFPDLENIDYLHYTSSMTSHDVLTYMRLAADRKEADFVAIDYWNNVTMPPALLRECGGDMNRALGILSRQYQSFCEETGIPVVIIGQYTKEGMRAQESGKPADASGIGGPASWMQRAQLRVILHRPTLMMDDADLLVDPRTGEKTRSGKAGRPSSILDVNFNKATVGEAGLYQLRAYAHRYLVGSLPEGSMRL